MEDRERQKYPSMIWRSSFIS